MTKIKSITRLLLAAAFIVAGVLHFTHTEFYLTIMPPYLPYHRALVFVSGFFEIIGGIGLLTRFRRAAGYGLLLLLLAVFPANVQMAMGDERFPPLLLWLRLPLQFILMALVWWCSTGRDK